MASRHRGSAFSLAASLADKLSRSCSAIDSKSSVNLLIFVPQIWLLFAELLLLGTRLVG